ncbi:MAG: SDR family oxidoreductase [Solirubrobacterales bacterium]|nr:SDR family oxidoreductase [Solirubrobacterales bacterium]
MSFQNKRVLITGGTSGIGLAAAAGFASGGAEVLVSGRDASRGEAAAAQTGAMFLAADLSVPGAARKLAADAGQVDVLVNNAGIFPGGPTHEVSDETLREVLEVNVVSAFALAAELAPQMTARGSGAIINVSTMVATFGLPGLSAYGASKAAIETLTKYWAAEYGGAGVRVNTVAPGPTRTPGTAVMGEAAVQQLASTLPAQRPAAPEEIAAAIVFLASDQASYINGAVVPVDGGRRAV